MVERVQLRLERAGRAVPGRGLPQRPGAGGTGYAVGGWPPFRTHRT